jgi:hypothetical protein
MKKLLLVGIVLWFSTSTLAFASVSINEIAWMGNASSSANEWIELVNDATTSVQLSGWHIVGKGGAPNIALSGSIEANSYFLIERTDDLSVPNVDADLVASFGKGLSNTGETLKLTNASGTVVDIVIGGTNWSKIGGDNVTKKTAQRTLSGWITASPTPRAPNIYVIRPTAHPQSATALPVQNSETQAHQVNKVAGIDLKKSVAIGATITPAYKTEERIAPASTTDAGANIIWQRNVDQAMEKRAWGWMISLILLVILASIIIMRTNVSEPTEADKYAIIEDIIEGAEEEQLTHPFED